ncbi:MAG: hypothetical protein V7746_17990 [Halioglobus sp.]
MSASAQLIECELANIDSVVVPNGCIDGVDPDLRVRPFFHHGQTISIREFIIGAFKDEMGLQGWHPILCQVTDPENPQTIHMALSISVLYFKLNLKKPGSDTQSLGTADQPPSRTIIQGPRRALDDPHVFTVNFCPETERRLLLM